MGYSVNDLIVDSLLDMGLDNVQVNNTRALRYLNRAYHFCENKIVNYLKDNYFRNVNKKINLINNQNEYALPTGLSTAHTSPSAPMLKKLMQVAIKYSDDQSKYYPANIVDYSWIYEELEDLKTKATKEAPLMIISWGSLNNQKIEIFPTPTENVTDWIKIDYEASNIDLLISDTEATIRFDRQYMYVLQYWMEYRIVKRRKGAGSTEEVASYQRFIASVNDMLMEISDRIIRPGYIGDPTSSLISYMY